MKKLKIKNKRIKNKKDIEKIHIINTYKKIENPRKLLSQLDLLF